MSALISDIRYALRQLVGSLGLTAVVVGILAIGIAGTVTVFSLFNGLFLRPFPIPNQDRVVKLNERDPRSGRATVGMSYSAFHAWRQDNQTFERMGFSSFWASNVSINGAAERVSIRLVNRDFLNVLGLRPVLGRGFTAAEDRPGGPNVLLLSHGLWSRLFAKDPAVLGRVLRLDNEPYTVIGVLPPAAAFPEPKDVWQPLRADPVEGHHGMGTMAMGLLKEGVTVERAREDLTHIHQGWVQQQAKGQRTTLPVVTPLREWYQQMLAEFRIGTAVLLGVVGFVLLIACCNVTSILLARGATRSKETAMRAALGAPRWRIVQQVLVESFLLSAIGGALGVLGGYHALSALLAQLADEIPSWMSFELDVRCVLFCASVVGLATILSGLPPALHAAFPENLPALLQSMSTRATASRGQRRTFNAVVTMEVALALTLLIGAILLVQAFHRVNGIDPGFRTAGILTYNISLPIGPYYDENKRRTFWDQHLEGIRALPGVTQAALSNYLPMTWPSFDKFEVEGMPPADSEQSLPAILRQRVTPGYFETLGVGVLAGRVFGDQDNHKDGESIAIVNETFAKRYWPGENPIDRRIRPRGSEAWIRVVGVVKDIVNSGLGEQVWPGVYLPAAPDVPYGMFGIVRTAGNPLSQIAAVRELVASIDPGLPVESVRTLSQHVHQSMWLRRLVAWLFGIPAAAAAIMAFAGIYGIISYSVSRRIQEIGIRMALGAGADDVVTMVVGQGFRLIIVGLVLGMGGGFVLSRLFAIIPGMLYNIGPSDPGTFIGGFLFLTTVALLACYIPARRVAKTDPMKALRYE